jgi:hypothetical protein
MGFTSALTTEESKEIIDDGCDVPIYITPSLTIESPGLNIFRPKSTFSVVCVTIYNMVRFQEQDAG